MSALCIGAWELFDSTHPADHDAAAALCAVCPLLDWCGARAHALNRAERSRPYRGMAGTWAGRIYGIPRSKTKLSTEHVERPLSTATRTVHAGDMTTIGRP